MKTFLIGIILGLFGAFAVALAFGLQWPTWVMFIAWVSYYIFGKTLKTSLLTFVQIIFGSSWGCQQKLCRQNVVQKVLIPGHWLPMDGTG